MNVCVCVCLVIVILPALDRMHYAPWNPPVAVETPVPMENLAGV